MFMMLATVQYNETAACGDDLRQAAALRRLALRAN
jgi:hypothetical protein